MASALRKISTAAYLKSIAALQQRLKNADLSDFFFSCMMQKNLSNAVHPQHCLS